MNLLPEYTADSTGWRTFRMMSVIGLLQLFAGFGLMRVPIPIALFFIHIRVPAPLFANGTLWLLGGFLLITANKVPVRVKRIK